MAVGRVEECLRAGWFGVGWMARPGVNMWSRAVDLSALRISEGTRDWLNASYARWTCRERGLETAKAVPFVRPTQQGG